MFGNQLFSLYESGGDLDGDGLDDIRFDNVTLLLNAVDSLTGEDRFIELRKRKPQFRRLTTVDELTREARQRRDKQIDEANKAAEQGLAEAQKALDAAVEAIRSRTGLDETTKAIMMESAEAAENRRLQAKQQRIEQDKERAIARTELEHRRQVGEVQDRIRLLAVLIPPIPALLLGGFIFVRKRRREQETIPQTRRRAGARS
jgi:ABC-2 type transport system permease protein